MTPLERGIGRLRRRVEYLLDVPKGYHKHREEVEELEAVLALLEPGSDRIRPVVQLVARRHGLGVRELLGRGRRSPHALSRHTAMWLARHCLLPTPSYPEIGRSFGRDHTTVMNGCRRVAERYAADPWFRRQVWELVRELHRDHRDEAKHSWQPWMAADAAKEIEPWQ